MPTQSQQPDNLRASVIDRFRKVATAPDQETEVPGRTRECQEAGLRPLRGRCPPIRRDRILLRGGEPILLGQPLPDHRVLDLGCGAGFDTLLAAQMVGPNGKVIGVDMTPEMIAKARNNAENLGVMNVEFVLGEIEHLPLPDASFDLVISNGVFNLCPDKPRVLSEVFRVLKPGGRLQMADILLEPHVTPEEVASKGSWSD